MSIELHSILNRLTINLSSPWTCRLCSLGSPSTNHTLMKDSIRTQDGRLIKDSQTTDPTMNLLSAHQSLTISTLFKKHRPPIAYSIDQQSTIHRLNNVVNIVSQATDHRLSIDSAFSDSRLDNNSLSTHRRLTNGPTTLNQLEIRYTSSPTRHRHTTDPPMTYHLASTHRTHY